MMFICYVVFSDNNSFHLSRFIVAKLLKYLNFLFAAKTGIHCYPILQSRNKFTIIIRYHLQSR